MIVCSENHKKIKSELNGYAEKSSDLDEYISYLEYADYPYDDVVCSSGRYILVFTGNADYEIIGILAEMDNGRIALRDF